MESTKTDKASLPRMIYYLWPILLAMAVCNAFVFTIERYYKYDGPISSSLASFVVLGFFGITFFMGFRVRNHFERLALKYPQHIRNPKTW